MSHSTPTISVVMAVYNEADTVATAIESILAQTCDDFECIVVDDGSTDDTRATVQRFEDSRIEYHRLEHNRGLPAALNLGIERATGDYLARMDADERSLPTRFERQIAAFENNPDARVVGCWYDIIDRKDRTICTIKPSNRGYSRKMLVEEGIEIAHGSTMIRRASLTGVDGYREGFKLAQDYDLWLRLAHAHGPGWLHVVPEMLYQRRIETGQVTKRPLQRLYASYARRCAECGYGDDAALLSTLAAEAETVDVRSHTQREAESHYQYLVGHYCLRTGHRARAIRRFLHSIRLDPFQLRAWYKLCLVPLPTSLRKRVVKTVLARLEQG